MPQPSKIGYIWDSGYRAKLNDLKYETLQPYYEKQLRPRAQSVPWLLHDRCMYSQPYESQP